MNYGDVVDDFLCEVRERGGFANDKTFDQIVGQVFFDKIKAAIEEEREACAKVCKEMSQYAKDVVMDKNAQKECRIALKKAAENICARSLRYTPPYKKFLLSNWNAPLG